MKKIFHTLILIVILIPFKVNAVTIGAPSNVTIRADGQFHSEGTSYTSGAWGLSGYTTDWLLNGGGSPTINSIWFHYPNLHQCANEEAIIKGKFFTTTNTGNQIFRDVIIQYEDSQTGSYSRCTVYPDQSRGNDVVDFICSGINAYSGNFVLSYLSQVPSDTSSMFQVAISNNLEVSCSPNNGTIINNQNQNTQDIINNNNQNTNDIKNSIASMGSSINSSIDGMKEKQQETNNKIDDMTNMDINDKDKELPDSSSYDDYNATEQELLDKAKEADLDVLDVGLDSDSSSWVWDTLTSLIKSHSVVFGNFISNLSICVNKIVLGR